MTRVAAEERSRASDFRTTAGEMDDGWVDAGHGQQDLIDFGPTSDSFTHLTTVPGASSGDADASKPQPSNNPFLRKKSTDGAEASVAGKEKEHEAAWAQFIPPSSTGASTSAGAPLPAIETFNSASGEIAGSTKGKARENEEETYEAPPYPPPSSRSGRAGDSAHQESGIAANTTVLPPPPPKNQTYVIKHVRWMDYRGGDSIRTTPILMQNLNGPCPLLALVNALTILAPPGSHNPLFETLRTREQVSLSLLLGAVVEELMTLRGDQAELPDMTELYGFLTELHTGMNVNPAFLTLESAPNLIDFEPNSPVRPPAVRKAGGFEPTKEIKLYSTFGVLLVHGWLPEESHPAYPALRRSARTHEDAENLLTREDELETKLAGEGLSEEEQRTLEDISAIKVFLNSSTTQLTGHGLEVIQQTMDPGGVAILFRNNHFSTLYKHPLTDHVFSLVTDMGYVKYDEIIWESLVDINGAGAELFSGDFRVVSHNDETNVQTTGQVETDDHEWTQVDRSDRRVGRRPLGDTQGSQLTPAGANSDAANAHEQEDADLALALQLQEEEEEKQRRQRAASQGANVIPQRDASSRQGVHHHRRRSSQQQQQQQQRQPQQRPQQQQQQTTSYGTIGRNPARPSQLVIRTGSSQGQGDFPQEGNGSSSSSNTSRPLRGAQASNSPFRGSSSTAPQTWRQQQTAGANDEEPPPPTYESALEDEPYIPPEDSEHHPRSPLPDPTTTTRTTRSATAGSRSGPLPVNFDDVIARAAASGTSGQPNQQQRQQQAADAPTMNMSAYNAQAGSSRVHRGAPSGNQAWPEVRHREKDCTVM